MTFVSRSGDSNPADGGGDGIGATGTIDLSTDAFFAFLGSS